MGGRYVGGARKSEFSQKTGATARGISQKSESVSAPLPNCMPTYVHCSTVRNARLTCAYRGGQVRPLENQWRMFSKHRRKGARPELASPRAHVTKFSGTPTLWWGGGAGG